MILLRKFALVIMTLVALIPGQTIAISYDRYITEPYLAIEILDPKVDGAHFSGRAKNNSSIDFSVGETSGVMRLSLTQDGDINIALIVNNQSISAVISPGEKSVIKVNDKEFELYVLLDMQ